MAVDPQSGQLLSDAAFAGDIQLIEALLSSGIPVDTRDNDGFTALHRSCVTGNVRVIEYLIGKKSSVNMEDSYGDSPLHYACFCGHLDAVRCLMAAGADPNKPSKDGKTPLQSAREENQAAVVALITGVSSGDVKVNAGAPAPASADGAPGYAPPAAPTMARPPTTALTPNAGGASLGGLDFTHGVIMEGELHKKRANKVMKWRKKYYVLSRAYGALFFWTGTRTRLEGVIKKVRFETFLSVKYYADKQNGKRFDLRVITGRTMQLLCNSVEDAKKWVATLNSVLGSIMAAIRIQAVYRGHRARKARKKMMGERTAAVARLAAAAGGVGSGTVAKAPVGSHAVHGALKVTTGSAKSGVPLSAEGILIESELKKKNSTAVASFLSAYRTRYFVLHQHDAALYYFESKAQRQAGVRPRTIPVLSFYSVSHFTDKKNAKTKTFVLRVVSGRSFIFEAKTSAEAEEWVKQLNSVLPRKNVAAIKIQKTIRMFVAKRKLKKMKAVKADVKGAIAAKYGKPVADLSARIIKIQAYIRMRVARRKYRVLRAAQVQAGAAGGGKASWLKFASGGAGAAAMPAGTTAAPPPGDVASAARTAKLREIALLREATAGPLPPPGAPPLPPGPFTGWTRYVDASTQREYWHNAGDGKTSWSDPGPAAMAGDWKAAMDAATNRVYWYNTRTGAAAWAVPADAAETAAAAAAATAAAIAAAALPPPPPPAPKAPRVKPSRWIAKPDAATGRTFYAEVDTGETRWSPPPGLADGTARLMGDWFSKAAADGSGTKYYVHVATSRTQWEKPTGYASDDDEPAPAASEGPLPPGWVKLQDPISQKPYYFNKGTSERRVDRPTGGAAADQVVDVSATTVPDGAKRKKAPPPASLLATAATGSRASRVTAAAANAAALAAMSSVVDVSNKSPKKASFRVDAAAESSRSPMRRSISMRRSGAALPDELIEALAGSTAATAANTVANGGHKKTDSEILPGWRMLIDPKSNRAYYFNAASGETTWDDPRVAPAPAALPTPSPRTGGDENEVLTFSSWVNDVLAADTSMSGRIPLDPLDASAANGLYSVARDGVLFCKLINVVAPDTVDLRAVALDAAVMDVPLEMRSSSSARGGMESSRNIAAEERRDSDGVFLIDRSSTGESFPALDNCRLAFASAQSIGCPFTRDVNPWNLADGVALAVLDFTWQLFKHALLAPITLRNPALAGAIRLAQEGEEARDLLRVAPEALLIRWLNFQLEAAGSALAGSIDSFGTALSDGVAFACVVRQVAPAASEDIPATDDAIRALGVEAAISAALSSAFAAGVPAWFSVEGIQSGSIRLQLAFCAYLMAAAPGLDVALPARRPEPAHSQVAGLSSSRRYITAQPSIATLEREVATLVAAETGSEQDSGQGREARTVAQWINSLDIEGVFVRDRDSLALELRDGTGVLQLMEIIEPGLVNWSRVNMRPTNRIKMVENCNYVINLGRACDFHLVNVAGLDIVDGNVKLLLAFMWQLMRHHTLRMLSKLAFDGFAADETEIMAWANEKVAAAATAAGQQGDLVRVSGFGDPELATGIYLLYLLNCVRPGCVNWSVVMDGDTREQQVANAKYVISTARRMGSAVFCTWEDIVEVKPRALLLFIASIMVVSSVAKADEAAAEADADDANDITVHEDDDDEDDEDD